MASVHTTLAAASPGCVACRGAHATRPTLRLEPLLHFTYESCVLISAERP